MPPDHFTQEEVEKMLRAEGRRVQALRYYLWQQRPTGKGFLYALEIGFDEGESLWIAYDEEAHGLCVADGGRLAQLAQVLHDLHGEAVIRRMDAHGQPLWSGVLGKTLQGVLLSKGADMLYANDAVLLDFGEKRIVLAVGRSEEGLQLIAQREPLTAAVPSIAPQTP